MLHNTKPKTPELGASLVEYALLVALLLATAIPSIRLIGESVDATFSSISEDALGVTKGRGAGENGGGGETGESD